MVEIRKYYLPPTPLVPNSPLPLLHYVGVLGPGQDTKLKFYDSVTENGWELQWLVRYGETQDAHYHSAVHECMAVLSGEATIRFGVADKENTKEFNDGNAHNESGAIELQAKAGDVFMLPAGVCHKTYDPVPNPGFKRLTPGDGHSVDAENVREFVQAIELSGFTMMGCYPRGHGTWDFMLGGENKGQYEKVWNVAIPARDPVFGTSDQGILTYWKQ